MRRAAVSYRRVIGAALGVALAACADDHGPGIDAGADAAPRDAFVADAGPERTDAGPEPVTQLATFELAGDAWDAVATVDGDVCIAAQAGPGDLPARVMLGDTFVACFDAVGLTRARSWHCSPGAPWGAIALATSRAGDLFVMIEGRACAGDDRSVRIERLDRGLATQASVVLSTASTPGPYFRSMTASEHFVAVGGTYRSPGVVGGTDIAGPAAVVLAAADLAFVRVVGAPAMPMPDAMYAFSTVTSVAIRSDDTLLLFGRDFAGGAIEPRSGAFERTVALPDGPLVSADAPDVGRQWWHEYGATWSPAGAPVVYGTLGRTTLFIGISASVRPFETGYLGAPHLAYRETDLLIARPFAGSLTIGDRTFYGDGVGADGAVLASVDPFTMTAMWSRQIIAGYRDAIVQATSDGMIAVLSRDPIDRATTPGMHLAFYR